MAETVTVVEDYLGRTLHLKKTSLDVCVEGELVKTLWVSDDVNGLSNVHMGWVRFEGGFRNVYRALDFRYMECQWVFGRVNAVELED